MVPQRPVAMRQSGDSILEVNGVKGVSCRSLNAAMVGFGWMVDVWCNFKRHGMKVFDVLTMF